MTYAFSKWSHPIYSHSILGWWKEKSSPFHHLRQFNRVLSWKYSFVNVLTAKQEKRSTFAESTWKFGKISTGHGALAAVHFPEIPNLGQYLLWQKQCQTGTDSILKQPYHFTLTPNPYNYRLSRNPDAFPWIASVWFVLTVRTEDLLAKWLVLGPEKGGVQVISPDS